jgi:phosphate acetyltransferase
MESPLYLAMMMQAVGDIDVTIGGMSAATSDIIRVAVEVIGVKENSIISSIGVLQVPGFKGSEEDMVVMVDCGVCPNPDATELAAIAIDTCDTVQDLFGWTPRCAMLSFSTLGSASNDLVDKVEAAVRLANERRPDLLIDGEFQVDTAIVPAVAEKKIKRESAVAGKANILIFPDLNAGNIGVKLVQTFAKANAVGPIMQGFNKIVTDSSRGATVSELVENIVISGVRAAVLKG